MKDLVSGTIDEANELVDTLQVALFTFDCGKVLSISESIYPLMFMRIQEFYENPVFKGKIVSRKEIETWNSLIHPGDDSSYTDCYTGFNLPRKTIDEFFELEQNIHLEEKILKKLVTELKPDYVIGVNQENLNHELTHALFALSPEYRLCVNCLMPNVPDKLKTALIQIGYCDEVITDEANAYLSNHDTNPIEEYLNLDFEDFFELQISLQLLRENIMTCSLKDSKTL